LLGIFTHGDFVRHFQFDSKIGERLVADLMTLNPVTVHKDKLAVEVLNFSNAIASTTWSWLMMTACLLVSSIHKI